MTRFWEELTPAQRRRVLARFRRSDPPAVTAEADAATTWDGLGLPERNQLLFGAGYTRATEPATSASHVPVN